MTPGESADTNPTIPKDKYASLPTAELVLFSVQHLHADGIPATTEEIVSTCFKLFPHRFSLKNYFYWPDSAQVVQALKYAREKGYVKDSQPEGYILRPAGRKLARQSAKAIGVRFPMPPKVEKQTAGDGQQTVEKPTTEEKPQTVKAKKSKPAPVKKKKQVKKVEKKVKKKAKPKLQKEEPAKKKTVKKAKPSVKKVVRKKTAVKKVTAPAKKTIAKPKKMVSKPVPKPKAQPTKPVAKPAPKKKAPVRKAVKKARAVTQLPLPVPAVPKKEAQKPVVKKKTVAKKVQPQVKQEAKPAVSKEEKVKAGKIIKQVERSDAYRQYKKLGAKARISEFDFRDMLFATMESSAETLKRNVDLFKRYAGIHSRADLITFLDFAEGSFAPLLKIQAKQPARKR
jgi:hypothetical protein